MGEPTFDSVYDEASRNLRKMLDGKEPHYTDVVEYVKNEVFRAKVKRELREKGRL